MKYFTLFVACLMISCNSKTEKQPKQEVETTTYYLIRHAEKNMKNPKDTNPSLSEEGRQRALDWVQAFKDIELDEIYSTQFKRTQETVTPVAVAKHLKIKPYGGENPPLQEMLKTATGKNILIVGHSNTVSEIANTIIGEEKFTPLSDDTYDLLFILVKQGDNVEDVVLKMP